MLKLLFGVFAAVLLTAWVVYLLLPGQTYKESRFSRTKRELEERY